MDPTTCSVCDDKGYDEAGEYCDCSVGMWYEDRDEHNLQVEEGLVDIGRDDDTQPSSS